MNIIVVSEHHKMPMPLFYNLGEHMLVITHDYESPHALIALGTPAERKRRWT